MFLTANLYAQHTHGHSASPPTGPADTLTTTSLRVDGLSYAREFDRIYWGDFDHLHIERNGLEFGLMMSAYMNDYGVICKSSLPPNKVEIMGQRCIEESYWVNGYGVEKPGSRSCTRYETYGTGVFADPVLYKATQFEDGKMATVMLTQGLSPMLKSGDAGINAAIGNLMQSVDVGRQVNEFKADLEQLLHNNTCGGAPLHRFEKNLIAYANGEQPIRMAGIPTNQGPFRDSDYQTLLDDLVSDQSRGWMFNRFVANSISDVRISLRDADGRPMYVAANYGFIGSKGRAEGTVKLTFIDGAPRCLFYSDVPDTCRAVDHRLAAAYEDGKYVTDHPAERRTYTAPDLRQVEVVIDHSQPLQVEVSNKVLDMQQGIVYPIKGKLLQDLRGTGPDGGSAVLVSAGAPVNLSVLNSQRGAEFYLARAGNDPIQAVEFRGDRQTLNSVGARPHDGSPIRLAFAIAPNIRKKILLTEYKKRETVAGPSDTPSTVGLGSGSVPGNGGVSPPAQMASTTAGKVLPAGTLLQLRFASAITGDQIGSQKILPATLVTARMPFSARERGETLAPGTTVYVRISQGSGNQYLIQADHAVVGGSDVPLETNALPRVAMRTGTPATPVQVKVWGNIRVPGLPAASGSTIVVTAGTIIQLSTKSDAVLTALPQ